MFALKINAFLLLSSLLPSIHSLSHLDDPNALRFTTRDKEDWALGMAELNLLRKSLANLKPLEFDMRLSEGIRDHSFGTGWDQDEEMHPIIIDNPVDYAEYNILFAIKLYWKDELARGLIKCNRDGWCRSDRPCFYDGAASKMGFAAQMTNYQGGKKLRIEAYCAP